MKTRNTTSEDERLAKFYASPFYRLVMKIPMRHCTKLVLVSMLFCTNTDRSHEADYGQTRVSQAYLADDVGRTTMTVRRALSELKELGVIHVRQRGLRYTNITTVNFERLLELADEAAEFRKGLRADRTKMIGLDDTQMSGLDRSEMCDDLSSSDLRLNDLEISEYASASPEESTIEQGLGERAVKGESEPFLPPITDEPQSSDGLPDLVVHFGDVIEATAYEEIVGAHGREEVADAPAQAALKSVQRHRYSLGAVALTLALSTGVQDAEIIASVREWVRKCVCVHTTTDQKHYLRILVAFLDGKAGKVGKMSGKLVET
jgi:hypothetical protein